jgi:O-antigen/teichoic acid export membrane protein
MAMTQSFGRSALVRAALLTTGSTYITFVLGLLVSVLIARVLGPDDYGRYAYVVWLSGILIMLTNNGLNMTGTKFVSEALGREEPETAARIHGWLLHKQWWAAGGVAVAFLACLPFIKPSGWEGHLAVLAAMVVSATLSKAFSLFNTSVAKGYGQFWIEALTNLVASVFNAIVAGFLAWCWPSTLSFVAMYMLTNLSYVVVSYTLMRRRALLSSSAPLAPEWLTRVKPHLLWTIGLTGLGALGAKSVETLLLNAWAGAADVGYYAIATGLSRGGVELLAAGLSTVVMPVFGYAFGSGDRERIRRVFQDTMRYYQFLGLIIAGVGWFWGEVLVHLMYGSKYMEVVSVFRIIVVAARASLANAAPTAMLTNSDNQRFRVVVTVLSVASTAVVCAVLIPMYGALGAACANFVTSGLSTAVSVWGIRRYVQLDAPWRLLAQQYVCAFLAAGVGYLVLWLFGAQWGAWAAGPIYVLALLLLSTRIGVWRVEEVAQAGVYMDRLPPRLRWLRRVIGAA